jgi:hypothetical protein
MLNLRHRTTIPHSHRNRNFDIRLELTTDMHSCAALGCFDFAPCLTFYRGHEDANNEHMRGHFIAHLYGYQPKTVLSCDSELKFYGSKGKFVLEVMQGEKDEGWLSWNGDENVGAGGV